jgi:hypothetical protein
LGTEVEHKSGAKQPFFKIALTKAQGRPAEGHRISGKQSEEHNNKVTGYPKHLESQFRKRAGKNCYKQNKITKRRLWDQAKQ